MSVLQQRSRPRGAHRLGHTGGGLRYKVVIDLLAPSGVFTKAEQSYARDTLVARLMEREPLRLLLGPRSRRRLEHRPHHGRGQCARSRFPSTRSPKRGSTVPQRSCPGSSSTTCCPTAPGPRARGITEPSCMHREAPPPAQPANGMWLSDAVPEAVVATERRAATRPAPSRPWATHGERGMKRDKRLVFPTPNLPGPRALSPTCCARRRPRSA